MPSWETKVGMNGARMQSAVPKKSAMGLPDFYRSQGILVRGVVLATYVTDEANESNISPQPGDQTAYYCDVLVYSGLRGTKQAFLPRCLVTQDRTGMHEGDLWIPRATTLDITGPLNANHGSNPSDMDGDHVLVGFLDDSFNLPVVLRGIPHPRADVGKTEDDIIGHRVRLRQIDGQPRFTKHRGGFYGVDDCGNFIIDLTRAHEGDYAEDGSELPPAEDGDSGNFTFRTQKKTKITLKLGDDREIVIDEENDKITIDLNELDLGRGADQAAVLGNILKDVLSVMTFTAPPGGGVTSTAINAATFDSFLSGSVKVKG